MVAEYNKCVDELKRKNCINDNESGKVKCHICLPHEFTTNPRRTRKHLLASEDPQCTGKNHVLAFLITAHPFEYMS